MKADVLPIDGAEHQAVQLLLPWRGNALLGAGEAARVEAHVAECPRCQADLAWQARLRLAAADAVPTEAPSPELDRRWMALRQQLASADTATAHPAQRRSSRRTVSLGWSFALAAQAALLVAFALVAWPALSPFAESYRALGSGPVNTAANAIIVFGADATEAQIRAALRTGDARLVGGPTVSDAYLLQLRTTDQAALARLRAQPGVLRVESLEAEATR